MRDDEPKFVLQNTRRRPPGRQGPLIVSFEDSALAVIAALRVGEVVTYGEVAARAGRPGAARAVGNVLARTHADVPWWRVVRSGGELVKGERQAQRLRNEGVAVNDGRIADPELRRRLVAGL